LSWAILSWAILSWAILSWAILTGLFCPGYFDGVPKICGTFVQNAIIEEVKKAKYFAIIADATPDSTHMEQTSLVIRYFKFNELSFSIKERFICFDNFFGKTGQEIASRLFCLLKELKLDLKNCVGQGYDNGANMAGKYNGAQAVLLKENDNCTFCSFGNHTLNLVGVNSAKSCNEAIFFLVLYNKFIISLAVVQKDGRF